MDRGSPGCCRYNKKSFAVLVPGGLPQRILDLTALTFADQPELGAAVPRLASAAWRPEPIQQDRIAQSRRGKWGTNASNFVAVYPVFRIFVAAKLEFRGAIQTGNLQVVILFEASTRRVNCIESVQWIVMVPKFGSFVQLAIPSCWSSRLKV